MTKEIFNEQSLLSDIIKQWGEHGAHAEVCRYLINELNNNRTMIQNLVDAERAYAQTYSQYEDENPALDRLNELWDQLMALPWIK